MAGWTSTSKQYDLTLDRFWLLTDASTTVSAGSRHRVFQSRCSGPTMLHIWTPTARAPSCRGTLPTQDTRSQTPWLQWQ